MEGQQLDLEGNPVGVPWSVTFKRKRTEENGADATKLAETLTRTVRVMAVAQPEAIVAALDASPDLVDTDTLTVDVKPHK